MYDCDGFDVGLHDALQADLLDKKSLALLNPYLVSFWDFLSCLSFLGLQEHVGILILL
jgi:hypothetical protein